MKEIHSILKKEIMEEYKKTEFKSDKVINGFDWNNTYGTDSCWLALYPQDKSSHREAVQLFLRINRGEEIESRLALGDKLEVNIEERRIKETNIEKINLGTVVNLFIDVFDLYQEVNREEIETDMDTSTNYWLAGYTYGDDKSMLDQFINQGVIGIGFLDEDLSEYVDDNFDEINKIIDRKADNGKKALKNLFKIKKGDYIALKSTYTEGKNHKQSVMKISAIGKVKTSPVDGYKYDRELRHTLPVDWFNVTEKKYYKNTGYWETLMRVSKDEVIEDLFKGIEDGNEAINYFWLTSAPTELRFDNKVVGEVITFHTVNQTGGSEDKRLKTDIEKIESGDKIVAYHSYQRIKGVWAILEALGSKENKAIDMKVIKKFDSAIDKERIEEEFNKKIDLRGITVKEIDNDIVNIINEIAEKELEVKTIEVKEVDKQEKEIPTVDFNQKLEIEKLHFSDENEGDILQRVQAALKNGKHIILTGPPGTGKSKLAKEICESYVTDYQMVTANSNWSTFDTIGGYQPNKDNELNFNSGVFLDCFKTRGNTPKNQWLIIDEINRADIDKAFGSLFSALIGDEITLSFKAENDRNVVVKPQEDEEVLTTEHEYIIPDDWRLIATMNTLDKTSLYEMSYAFMRRFAFIPISIPEEIDSDLIENYLDCWEIDNRNYIEQVAGLWTEINKVRKIGPAIVEDMYNYLVETGGDYTSALIMYVLPQFEGVRSQKLDQFINDVVQLDFIEDEESLRSFAVDYFMLEV